MKKIWGFKLKSYNFFLIITMAAANIIMNYAAQYLNYHNVPMPLWLDSVGIIVAAMEAGPIAGALAGLPVYGMHVFTRPDWALFSVNSVLIGIAGGLFIRVLGVSSWKKAVVLGLLMALIDIILSSVFDHLLYDGLTGFGMGDMVFNGLPRTMPYILRSLTAECVMSIPDKVISVLLAYMICSSYSLDRIYVNSEVG